MRFWLFSLSLICALNLFAHDYSIKSVSLLHADLRASTNLRNDKDGKPCAMIKVNVIGIYDLDFPDAVGKVEYSIGEYIVYVPEKLKVFTMSSSKKKLKEKIVFDDYGIDEIEGKRVYSVVLESNDNTRAAIFSVHPQSAKLQFNGKNVKLDESGMAFIENTIGEYSYEVSSEGYITSSGVVCLTKDNISTTTNVVLQQIKHSLTLICNVDDAILYIDDITQGALNEVYELNLTTGNHMLRLTAPGYKDYEQQIYVDGERILNITMNKIKEKVVKYKEERSRTKVSVRNAHYLKFSAELYDQDKYFGFPWGAKLEYSHCSHFWAIGEFRTGIGIGIMGVHDDAKTELYGNPSLSDIGGFFELPLQMGFGIPFGKYNKHLVSVLAGGYGKGYFVGYKSSDNGERSVNTYAEYDYKKEVYGLDFGLRANLNLDISKYSISFELSQSLKDGGFYPGIAFGWKFY